MPGELLFCTREDAEAHRRAALAEGDDGRDRDNGGDEEEEQGDKGGEEGGEKGDEKEGEMWGKKEGDREGEKGGSGSKDAPPQPPSFRRGSLRVATRERGA